MSNEVILTCAVSGGHNNQARHPDYPITPEHIARDCIEAAQRRRRDRAHSRA